MIVIILILYSIAVLAPVIDRLQRPYTGWVLAFFPATSALYLSRFGPWIIAGVPISPQLDLIFIRLPQVGFYLDGISLIWAVMTLVVGTAVTIYSGYYFRDAHKRARFIRSLYLLLASVVGTLLAGNLLLVIFFWGLAVYASFSLLSFNSQRAVVRKTAPRLLLVLVAGWAAISAGLLLIGIIAGSFEVTRLVSGAVLLFDNTQTAFSASLIAAGVLLSTAQVPFSIWRQGIQDTPSPGAAVMQTVGLVALGLYLLLRVSPMIDGGMIWRYSFSGIGLVMILAGAVGSLAATELKRILIEITFVSLGVMLVMNGLGTEESYYFLIIFFIIHSLYKTTLFLLAGIIEQEIGCGDIQYLGRLIVSMPLSGLATVCAAIAMTGFSPLLASLSRELIYEAMARMPVAGYLVTAIGLSGAMVLVATALRIVWEVFLRSANQLDAQPHEAAANAWLPALAIGAGGMVTCLFWTYLVESIAVAATLSLAAERLDLYIALWHGFNPAWMVGGLILLGGFGLFLMRDTVRRLLNRSASFNHQEK